MKVLYLSAAGEIGGGNSSLLAVWPELRRKGVDVHAVIPADGSMAAACRDLHVPYDIIEYHQPSLNRPRLAWSAYQEWLALLRRARPDLVHANALECARSI